MDEITIDLLKVALNLLWAVTLTVVVECIFHFTVYRKGELLPFVANVNISTNLCLNTTRYAAVSIGIELGAVTAIGEVVVVLIEWLAYRKEGSCAYPFAFSVLANVLSYSAGCLFG